MLYFLNWEILGAEAHTSLNCQDRQLKTFVPKVEGKSFKMRSITDTDVWCLPCLCQHFKTLHSFAKLHIFRGALNVGFQNPKLLNVGTEHLSISVPK